MSLKFWTCLVTELAIAIGLFAFMWWNVNQIPTDFRVHAIVPLLLAVYWPRGGFTVRIFYGDK